ncbi:hypothetical protein [Pedobacter frigoris]|uniref:hypothetical protein n=1 Tax=Pedobacter frigoris TaxID=2571272 RepID=UPI00293104A2|nr:hypothetical protein [Pedobacter frigoris]
MKKVKMLMLAVILLAVAYGCQKVNEPAVMKRADEKKEAALIANRDNSLQLQSWTNVANNSNPYDDSGRRHNEILDALDKHMEVTRDGSRAAKKAFIIHYCKQQGIDLTESLAFMEPIMAKAEQDDYTTIFNYPGCTPVCDKYVRRLRQIVAGVEKPADWNGFIPAVKGLEEEISNSDLKDQDKEALLSVASVARYSGAYWYERRPKVPLHNDQMPRWLNAIVRWQAAVTCDMMSATLGMITFSRTASEDASAFSSFVNDGIRDNW